MTLAKFFRQNQEYFPPIVIKEVEKLLSIKTKADVPNAMHILNDLHNGGISSVWDKIKASVTKITKRKCGTIFPDSLIEEGQNLPLDLHFFRLLVSGRIAVIDPGHKQENTIALALQMENPQFRERLHEYLQSNPYQEPTTPSLDVKDEPSLSDKLMELSDLTGKMALETSKLLLALTSAPFTPEPRESNIRTPGFFSPRPVLGCEPPPGSIVDEAGNTTVPKPH